MLGILYMRFLSILTLALWVPADDLSSVLVFEVAFTSFFFRGLRWSGFGLFFFFLRFKSPSASLHTNIARQLLCGV